LLEASRAGFYAWCGRAILFLDLVTARALLAFLRCAGEATTLAEASEPSAL
jgi:hypothetical protein